MVESCKKYDQLVVILEYEDRFEEGQLATCVKDPEEEDILVGFLLVLLFVEVQYPVKL